MAPGWGATITLMTEEEAIEKWPDLEQGERERRRKLSIAAKERHNEIVDPETGRRKFGGPQPGSGRPRKKRAAEAIAERAQQEHDKVARAIFSGLDPRNSPSVRVNTATKIIDIERKERELQLRESELDGKTDEEITELLINKLAEWTEAGKLPDPGDLSSEPFVEGTVVED